MCYVNWSAVSATTTVFYALAFVVSLLLLMRQLRSQSLSEAYERLQDESVRIARGRLYELDESKIVFETWKVNEECVEAAEMRKNPTTILPID
jgi:hypothetical protein